MNRQSILTFQQPPSKDHVLVSQPKGHPTSSLGFGQPTDKMQLLLLANDSIFKKIHNLLRMMITPAKSMTRSTALQTLDMLDKPYS